MAMQNLQIPETAESRIVPKWLFPPLLIKDCHFLLLAVNLHALAL
jgi:hypothetical protein